MITPSLFSEKSVSTSLICLAAYLQKASSLCDLINYGNVCGFSISSGNQTFIKVLKISSSVYDGKPQMTPFVLLIPITGMFSCSSVLSLPSVKVLTDHLLIDFWLLLNVPHRRWTSTIKVVPVSLPDSPVRFNIPWNEYWSVRMLNPLPSRKGHSRSVDRIVGKHSVWEVSYSFSAFVSDLDQ